MEPKIGLIIQFTGVFLITVLMLFLHRSLKNAPSKYWTIAWASLACALFSLSFAHNYISIAKLLFGLYLFAQYLFGMMLIVGCRSLSEDYNLEKKTKLFILPLAVLGFLLPFAVSDLNLLFKFHAVLLASFFAFAFYSLKSIRLKSFGYRVMRVALALLALDFFHYAVIFSLLDFDYDVAFLQGYLTFVPIFDLVLEILLGFGMVIVSLEKVLQEVKTVNEKLEDAHHKLEHLAHIDPLTTTFNRHAFYGFLKNSGEERRNASGCVGFFDIDDLKPINDEFGHAVGDAVIRTVAGAIRDLIRAEDVIYRWGGDEFFVIMVGMNAELARSRMSGLEKMLSEIEVEGLAAPLTITVSFGFTDFTSTSGLEEAVKFADQEMYRFKHEHKRDRQIMPPENFPRERKASNSLSS